MKNLGEGSFGLVKLVQHKETKGYYAMKTLVQSKAVKLKQGEHTMNEKKGLAIVSHPFLVNLKFHFMDAVRNSRRAPQEYWFIMSV